jgi:hypothetical protein
VGSGFSRIQDRVVLFHAGSGRIQHSVLLFDVGSGFSRILQSGLAGPDSTRLASSGLEQKKVQPGKDGVTHGLAHILAAAARLLEMPMKQRRGQVSGVPAFADDLAVRLR